MKKQVFSIILALCFCMSAIWKVYAEQENLSQQNNFIVKDFEDKPVTYNDTSIPTYNEAYESMIALKENSNYSEGTPWTNNNNPITGTDSYRWKGGKIDNVESGVGCVAFAFMLSDKAFGNLPARKITNFKLSDVKVGDILRVNNLSHTVIVLQVTDEGVIIAEGNFNNSVHWGRSMSKADVESANYIITRYPEGYIPPDDPTANDPIDGGEGSFGNLKWKLTKAGTLTISGKGAMPEDLDIPWESYNDKILKIVIEDGVTNIVGNAFYNSTAISVTIPASVKSIGYNAFRNSKIVSITVPSSVEIIDDGAFRECQNLVSVTISNGVKTIVQNAFRACTALTSIALPASIESVGAGAFMECTSMESAIFYSDDDKTVHMGDDMFARCYKLNTVTLPKKIDKIADRMFQNCLFLLNLNIPQGTESIGMQAFASCSSLTKLTIPDSVTQIWTAAFSACPLKDIYFTGDELQWNKIRKLGDVGEALKTITIHYNDSGIETTSETSSESSSEFSSETSSESSSEFSSETSSESSSESGTSICKPEIIVSELEPENNKEIDVLIKTNEENAKIYYTIDGTEPTINFNEYIEPFKIRGTNETIIIKAIAVVNDRISAIAVKEVKFSRYDLSDIQPGDVDGKRNISINDAAMVLQKVLNSNYKLPIEEKTNNYMKYADIDGDGKLTALDASIILQKALSSKLITPVKSEN